MSNFSTLSETRPLKDWSVEVIDGDRSKNYPKREEFVDSGVPFLNSTNFIDNRLDISNLNYITHDKAEGIRKGKVERYDIVMTTRGSIGKLALFNCKYPSAVINAQMLILRADKVEVDSKFLYYTLLSDDIQVLIKNFASGSAQPQIPIRDLVQVPLSLPPFPIQRRIASILSAYDDLIENNTRRIKILEEMAQRIYQEWFVHFRFPGHETVKKEESDLGKIPSGWEVKKLKDLCFEKTQTIKPNEMNPDTPYVGLEHIPRKSITLSDWGLAGDIESTKKIFKVGDILFGKIRPYFHKVSVAPTDGISSTDAIVIQANETKWFPLVLSCTSSEAFVSHATQTSQGTKMPRANWKVLEEYPVVIGSDGIMDIFNDNIAAIVAQTQNLMWKNRNLRQTRDLLLPKLISGEIDVSDMPEPKEVAA